MDPTLPRRELLPISEKLDLILDIQDELVSQKPFAYTPQVSINLAL